MTIALVSPFSDNAIGGINSWTKGFIVECENQGIDICLINSAVIGKRATSSSPMRKHSFLEEIKRAKLIAKQIKIAKKNVIIDLCHFNSSCSSLGIIRDYLLLRKFKDIPVVFHCHCNIEDCINGRLSLLFFKKCIRLAKNVFVLNQSSKKFVEKLSTDGHIYTIPNFVDSQFIKEKHIIRNYIERVLFVGQVRPEKGVYIIREVAKKMPNTIFAMIGPVMIDDTDSFSNNVYFLGKQDKTTIMNSYSESDVFLFPSFTEGFSLSLLEAMASGIPCIASDVGANREMLNDKGGIVLKNNCCDDIVDAFNKIKGKKVREAMSIYNINKVKNSFTSEQVVRLLSGIYNSTIENANGGQKNES